MALGAGSRHTCAVKVEGDAYCWGDNRQGQLGTSYASECGLGDSNDEINCRTRPAQVQTSLKFLTITTGGEFTCGIATAGRTYCWGDGSRGQLGGGSQTKSMVPVELQGNVSFITLSAGQGHTCGLTSDGVAYCWGAGSNGELGDGTGNLRLLPTRVMHQ